MAIGTAAAIGLGVAGVGSVLGASSQNSASRRAAETSQQNNTQNTALLRETRDMSLERLDRFVARGNAAGDQINALLGLGGTSQPQQAQQVQPNALSQFGGQAFQTPAGPMTAGDFREFRSVTNGAGLPYGLGDNFITTGTFNNGAFNDNRANALQSPGFTTESPQDAAQGAFDTFRNSTGYQFRLGEGLDAVNSAYAGIGGFQSGAAMRGIQDYAQNFASNEFGNYLGALQSQQAVGAGGASASAGVSQNFGNTVAAQNNFNAQNQMGAQLGQQNAFANLAGTVGGGLLSYGVGR